MFRDLTPEARRVVTLMMAAGWRLEMKNDLWAFTRLCDTDCGRFWRAGEGADVLAAARSAVASSNKGDRPPNPPAENLY